MNIEIKIDEKCTETKVVIITNKMTQEINDIMKKLSDTSLPLISGFRNDVLEIIDPKEIIRVYASNQKVYAKAQKYEYVLKLRLYEVEEKLDNTIFVRISNSEIINLKMVQNFDLSLRGTICVKLFDGTVTYVSRRYVTKIKQLLGI